MSEKKASSHPVTIGKNLADKAILVTGGASGLGAALCHVLSEAGANIIVGDLNHDKAPDALVDCVSGIVGVADVEHDHLRAQQVGHAMRLVVIQIADNDIGAGFG